MIETPEQVWQAIEQMGRMQRLLESCRDDILSKSPKSFAVFAGGPLEQLRQLVAQLDEYTARQEIQAPEHKLAALRETPPDFGPTP